ELCAGGLADAPGRRLPRVATTCGLGDEDARQHGEQHDAGKDREPRRERAAGLLGERTDPELPGLDRPDRPCGPGRVVVPERGVVAVVDVAGGVLALEILDGAQKEVPLLLQRGQRVRVERAGARAHGRAPPPDAPMERPSSSARSTSSRSAAVARSVPPSRQRQNAYPTPARPRTMATTGTIHTRPAIPEPFGVSSTESPHDSTSSVRISSS